MSAFKVVKRSDLPTGLHRFHGTHPSAPKVHLQKTGILNFSKLASEVFKGRRRAMVEYEEQSRVLRFTALDRLPRGFDEADTFPICHHEHKGKPLNCTMTVKRLLAHLKFDHRKQACTFAIADIDQERCSIAVVLPNALHFGDVLSAESVPDAQPKPRATVDAFAERDAPALR